jgi:hypothetical protein
MLPGSKITRARECRAALLLLAITVGWFTPPAWAQPAQPPLPAPLPDLQPPPTAQQAPLPYPPPPPAGSYPPQELDRIVQPIALYPDPLLAQLLAATTFAPEIPDAARWADQHHYLPPDALAAALAADRVPWQPSVQALVPFPSVLDMMASDMPWTQELGSAFLVEPPAVMDAVQRMRRIAMSYGYLRSSPRIVVRGGPYIEILPANPAFMVVPYYSPAVVFAAPRPGFVVAGAVNFGFGISIGPAFAPWGWGTSRFVWANHAVFVNNAAWGRTWANRAVYVHPYAVPRYAAARAGDQHRLIERSERERDAARNGRAREEEHKKEDRR